MLSDDQLLAKTKARFPEYAEAMVTPLYEGGSDRHFYRIQNKHHSLILVHYNSEKAENNYYAEHALFLKKKSLSVPTMLGHAPNDQLLWLEDLGEKNLWSVRHESWSIRRPLYEATLSQVAQLHCIPLGDVAREEITLQPPFDEHLYQWEQHYFLEHALRGLFHISEEKCHQLALSPSLKQLVRHLAALPQQLIHRDFQSQNIIITPPQVWLIDFQGMRAGLAPYDLASLLCDPYVTITSEEREELLQYYYREIEQAGFSLPYDASRVFWQCAVQRLMQALGAYGFLSLHRGKPHFQQYVSPALYRLREALSHLHAEDRLEELEQILLAIKL